MADKSSDAVRNVLESIVFKPLEHNPLLDATVQWVRPICLNRQYFKKVALLLGPMGEHGVFSYGCANQKTYELTLTKWYLVGANVELTARGKASLDGFHMDELNYHQWNFETNWVQVCERDIVVPPGVEWFVVPNMTFSFNNSAHADFDAERLEDFVKGLPEVPTGAFAKRAEKTSTCPSADAFLELMVLYPFAAESVLEDDAKKP
jgi:hypothetical protein